MRRKIALGLSMAAVLWGLALIVGALSLPVYRGTTISVACPGCPEAVSTEERTLVEVNGPRVLIVVALPLVVSALVAVTLWTGRPSTSAAWVLIALLWLFTLLAILSIGIFVAPSALLLTLAAALAGRHPASKAAAPSRP